jgi:hypothetical protein
VERLAVQAFQPASCALDEEWNDRIQAVKEQPGGNKIEGKDGQNRRYHLPAGGVNYCG